MAYGRTKAGRVHLSVRGTPFHAVNNTSRLDTITAYGERQNRTNNKNTSLPKEVISEGFSEWDQFEPGIIQRYCHYYYKNCKFRPRSMEIVIDGRLKDLHEFEQKGDHPVLPAGISFMLTNTRIISEKENG